MKLKSYFSASVGEAIERARQELGADAMLLNSRKLAAEQKHLGSYEVVFGVTGELAASKKTPAVPTSARPAEKPGTDALAREMAEIRKQLETVKQSISGATFAGHVEASPRPEIRAIHQLLLDADFSSSLAEELIAAAEMRSVSDHFESYVAAESAENIEKNLLVEIDRRFAVSPELGKPGADRRIVMLVGPPGAGKTTTLVKLAVKYGLSARTPLRVLSTDTLRVGGAEQLAAYARIIGIGFDAVHSMAGLSQMLEENRSKRLVLIDTPGFGSGDMEEAQQLAGFVKRNPEIEVQLVLPAYSRLSVLRKFSERFEIFRPSKLLFTHLDEIETTGGILEHAMKTGLPLSFLANGQGIPQDFVEATKPRLTEWLSYRSQAAALSA